MRARRGRLMFRSLLEGMQISFCFLLPHLSSSRRYLSDNSFWLIHHWLVYTMLIQLSVICKLHFLRKTIWGGCLWSKVLGFFRIRAMNYDAYDWSKLLKHSLPHSLDESICGCWFYHLRIGVFFARGSKSFRGLCLGWNGFLIDVLLLLQNS